MGAQRYQRSIGVRPRARVRARIRAAKLDRDLAGGESPGSSPAIALRAENLTSWRMRRELAHSLQRLLARTSKPPLGPRLSPNRDHLADARSELALLARRLLIAPSVDARGVARVRILLSDGAGPLLWTQSDADLSSAVREAIEALESEAEDQRRERKNP